uniref:Mannose-P-dolichol utilization defect 1 protein homolog n=1 Tax=Kalanchoe fedtschenkoi TaxID=63787 RepID=A0A7N0UQ98_KALFE
MEIFGIDLSCAYESISNGEMPAKSCLLSLLSKILGYCIIAMSATVKFPQILKILKNQSIAGLSVAAFELDVVGYTIALAYCIHIGLPFSAFGELFFLYIQALILIAIMHYYSRPVGIKFWIKAILYSAIVPTIFSGRINPMIFEALYASQHVIFFSARLPQIWKNFKNKSTGQLSFMTTFINFGGSLTRVFTSIQEGAPLSLRLGSVRASIMNGVVLSQILLYQVMKHKSTEKAKVS